MSAYPHNSFAPLLDAFNANRAPFAPWFDKREIYRLEYWDRSKAIRFLPPFESDHAHRFWEIHLFMGGEQIYEINGESLRLHAGELLMIPPLAINELEKMVKIPYIDGFVFGPCDLSNDIGDHMNVFTGETHEWLKKAIRILKENGKYIGISHGGASTEIISHWHDLGIDMISSGSDFTYLLEYAQKTLQNLKEAHIER